MDSFIDNINHMYNITGGDTHNIIFGFLVAGYFLMMAIDAWKSENEVQ